MFHVKRNVLTVLLLTPIIICAQNIGVTKMPALVHIRTPSQDTMITAFLRKVPIPLDRLQEEWFYWTNYVRINPRRSWDSLIAPVIKMYPSLYSRNSESLKAALFTSPHLSLLKPNKKLVQMASLMAEEMAEKNATLSHVSPGGVTFENRIIMNNIYGCAAENLSLGQSNVVLMLILLLIDEGVPNLGHRRSLLNPEFSEMGIGSSVYADGKALIVQDFACDQQPYVSRETPAKTR